MRFFSAFKWLERTSIRMGMQQANASFLEALVNHEDSIFDEFVFTHADKEYLMQLKQFTKSSPHNIIILPFNDAMEYITENKVDVMHCGDWCDSFRQARYIRHFTGNESVITGQVHALNTKSSEYWVHKHETDGLGSREGIFCSSWASRIFLSKNLKMDCGRLIRVPLGIPSKFLEDLKCSDNSYLRNKLSIPEYTKIVLTVARFSPSNKFDPMPIVRLFQNELKDFHWVIAGSNDNLRDEGCKAAVKRYIFDNDIKNISIIGQFQEDEKAHIYSSADIFLAVADSYQETFGISLVEASVADLPIVASDFSGYSDTIDEAFGLTHAVPVFARAFDGFHYPETCRDAVQVQYVVNDLDSIVCGVVKFGNLALPETDLSDTHQFKEYSISKTWESLLSSEYYEHWKRLSAEQYSSISGPMEYFSRLFTKCYLPTGYDMLVKRSLNVMTERDFEVARIYFGDSFNKYKAVEIWDKCLDTRPVSDFVDSLELMWMVKNGFLRLTLVFNSSNVVAGG